MAAVHNLKILPEYFYDVKNGNKTFEVRKDDRNYRDGDFLMLSEWFNGGYTGRTVKVLVTYLLRDTEYVKDGFVIMGIRKV